MNFAYTPRQLEILKYIAGFQQQYNYSPSYKEIAKAFTVSDITIFEHVEALEKKGAVRKVKFKNRSIEILDPQFRPAGRSGGIPVRGRLGVDGVVNPVPGIAEELPLGDLVNGEGKFLVELAGEGIAQRHLVAGDVLVVDPARPLALGNLVLVRDGERHILATVGRAPEGFKATGAMAPHLDYPATSVAGVVRGAVRRL